MVLRNKRWLSLVIAVMMFIPMLPVYSVNVAAATQAFTFPSASSTADIALTNPINTQVISQFYGTYSQTVPQTLSYSVQQQVRNSAGVWVDKGTPNTVTTATPMVFGPTNQEFYLLNVNLFVGMNKISVSTNGTESTCYLYYDDAPYINSISVNGTTLNRASPAYVTNAAPAFLIKTSNSSTLSVNGIPASSFGPGSFSVSNFQLNSGMNTLTFTAQSDTRLFSITRQVIYLDQPGAAYNVFLQNSDGTGAIQLDTGNVVSTSGVLPKVLTGKMAFPLTSNTALNPRITKIELKGLTATTLSPIPESTINYSLPGPASAVSVTNAVYDFSIDTSSLTSPAWTLPTNDTYQFILQGDYNDGSATPKLFKKIINFIFKDNTKPSIANVQQLFGVTNSSTGTGGTTGPFAPNLPSLPLYAQIAVNAPVSSPVYTPKLSVTQGGVTKDLVLDTDYNVLSTTANISVIKFLKLPYTGAMNLNVSLVDSSANIIDTYQKQISFSYNPIPSIVLNGIYNGQSFQSSDLDAFTGTFYNFVDSTDAASVVVTVNGRVITPSPVPTTSGFSIAATLLAGVLSQGPNEVKVTATVQGTPIETRLTVYYYPANGPAVTSLLPVPISPAHNNMVDLDPKKFVLDPSSNTTYNTTELKADILFKVDNATQIIVMKDGVQFYNIVPPATSASNNGIVVQAESGGIYRIIDLPLNVGSNSLVVKAINGPSSTFLPLTLVRNNLPYEVLSPRLPQERVINQNFVKVVISADGADSVLLGKTPMTRMNDTDPYFVGSVENLKKGKNTIKYTIVKGKQKTNDQFDITYANTNTIGGEFSTPLGANGKISAFNNAVTLTFPKGTMLTPYNDTSTKIELFDSQKILLGIADPADGRTVKTYNNMGNIVDIAPDPDVMLIVPDHFGYASPLYWIDAGYYDSSLPQYTSLDGMHPYYGDEMRPIDPSKQYNLTHRYSDNKWMKTTSRGTLTLQYDSSIRDFASNRVSIWRFGVKGSAPVWENIGGKVNTNNHTISASVDSFGFYTVLYNTYGFDDTQSSVTARDEMELLYARGIMNSKNPGEFGAYEPTTRGEFATILVKALNLPLNFDDKNILFFDVPHSLNASPYWDYRYIETAGQKGIARGVGTRQFAPDEPINRAQAAAMIAYALNLKLGTDLEKSKVVLDKIFSDSSKISPYSRPVIEAVYKAKLMTGRTIANPDPKGKPMLVFEPDSNITRAETGKVIVNLMRLKKLL